MPRGRSHLLKLAIVLFGEDFGGRHERHVEPAFHRHQRRAGRHDRLARADVALEQAGASAGPPVMSARISRSAALWASVSWNPSPVQKGLDEAVVAHAGEGARRWPRVDGDAVADSEAASSMNSSSARRVRATRGVVPCLGESAACESRWRASGEVVGRNLRMRLLDPGSRSRSSARQTNARSQRCDSPSVKG